MIRNLFVLWVVTFGVVFKAQAESSQSYDLYAQGKVLESVTALKKELRSQKFNALTLDSQYKRLLSAYRSHIGVTDQNFIETLELLLQQPAASKMEHDAKALLSEIKNLNSDKASGKQIANYLEGAVRKTDSGPRLARFQAAKIYSYRQSKSTSGEARAEWTFLAGKAGFYHFNSGNADLKLYLQMCERLGKVPACANIKEAQSMLGLGKSIESPHAQ